MKTGKRMICTILSATMIGTLLTGCSQVNNLMEKTAEYMDTDKTISKDSKWVNSDLVGVVTEDTSVSEKDDFATANNKDWILSVADQVEKKGSVSTLEENSYAVIQQKQDLLNTAINGGNFSANKIGMDTADYDHMTDTFTKVVSTAADWDARNAAGVTPLKDYISAIESIQSLDQMTQYLCNENEDFLSGAYFVPFTVSTSLDPGSEMYEVALLSTFDDSLYSEEQSTDLRQNYIMDIVSDVLGNLGYTSSEVKKIVKQCWQFEGSLSEHTAYKKLVENASYGGDDISDQFNNIYTKEELKDLSGNYPLMDILKAYNYDQSDSYIVYEPDYIRSVGKLYKEKNLEKMKSYYIVHTVLFALPLLTRDYYDKYEEYFTTSTDASDADTEQDDDTQKKDDSFEQLSKEDQILQNFITTYINEIFEEMYLTNYCSSEQKEYVQNLIQDSITEYETILAGEDWMSDATKEKAIEKLNAITARVLYPDELDDCNDLQIEKGNLLDIVARINAYNIKKDASKINTEYNKKGWNLQEMPSTTVNAYYSPLDNSISILAGVVANKEFLDINASDEENMAHLGYIIGHEISHAFDSSGYLYDKDGNQNKWWTDEDEEAFQKRVAKLANYYSTFKCFRNADNINGTLIQGEAIADNGGLKCMLAISHKKDNFDYQKFFRAYAHTWATCRKYSVEVLLLSQDNHPLPFLRTNVTIQQFDEFYDAFDIQPGDGMYLAPEKRIAVW